MRIASTASLKTPSRSTMRSCVRSSPSRWTFQYIQSDGAMTGFVSSFGPLRTSAASFGEISSSLSNTWSFSSTDAGARSVSIARNSRIFFRMKLAFVQT